MGLEGMTGRGLGLGAPESNDRLGGEVKGKGPEGSWGQRRELLSMRK